MILPLSIETMLPFFFVFAVVYGALEVSSVFKNKAVRAVISVVLGLFALSSPMVTSFVNQILPLATIVFVVVFFAGFIFKPFKGKGGKRDWLLIVLGLGLLLIFLAQASSPTGPLYSYINNTFISDPNFLWGAGLILLVLIFYVAYKYGKEKTG